MTFDKVFWQNIVDNEYKLPEDARLMLLTEDLLNFLALPDPELRDVYAYEILARWIVNYRYHEPDQLREMSRWLMEQLLYEIGSVGTDAVFRRSYAAAVLSLIMYRDDQEDFLDELEVMVILEQARTYLLEEKDTRAYIPEKGWVNAISNVAGLLKFIAHNTLISPAEIQQILHVIADKITQPVDEPFKHDEEDRLARVVTTILSRDLLTTFDFIDWARRFTEWKEQHHIHGAYNAVYNNTYQNVKRFLRALYIQMDLVPRLPISAQEFEPELLLILGEFSL